MAQSTGCKTETSATPDGAIRARSNRIDLFVQVLIIAVILIGCGGILRALPWPWRQIKITLTHDEPPRHNRKGWLARLDKWSVPPGPYSFNLSGWQIDFDRDELLAAMNKLRGIADAQKRSGKDGNNSEAASHDE